MIPRPAHNSTLTPAAQQTPLAPLVDGFGRVHSYLRISVTERCNLRCRYCMPAEGVKLQPREHLLTFEEIERLTGIFARMGIRKVRLTGGEPLVRRDLVELVARLAALPGIETLAMTTNGLLLAEHAVGLRAAGLTHLNLSLDTLRRERFERITLRDSFDAVMAGLEAALAAGFRPLKVNCVVMGGVNDDEVVELVEFVRDKPIQMRFIEYMPFKGNGWLEGELVPWRELRRRIEQRWELRPAAPETPSDVARDFTIDGFEGSVGFITSMTQDFCGTCNRVRVLADGSIKSCLFHAPEVCVREALRARAGDGVVEALIREAIARKAKGHEPIGELENAVDRSMIEIGG